MSLPRFIFLKSNAFNKYLRYSKIEKGLNHSLLGFPRDAKAELSESAKKAYELHYYKFEVQKAKTLEGFVHLRTCYNNKYWARKSEDSNLIVAGANEAEEDPSKWSCTLFKPVFLDDDVITATNTYAVEKKIHLLHVGDQYVGTDDSSNLAVVDSDSARHVFTITDADKIPILPKYVTFLGPNKKYLKPRSLVNGLQFNATDMAELGVANMIVVNGNNGIKIINKYKGVERYWYYSSFFRCISLYKEEPKTGVVFIPRKVGDNMIALKCKDSGFNKFANSQTYYTFENVLCADRESITKDTMLTVGEPVHTREVIEATYDTKNERISNVSHVDLLTESLTNQTSSAQRGSFEVEYKANKTMKWSQSASLTTGMTVSLSAEIPNVGDQGVVVFSRETGYVVEWGKEKTKEQTYKYTQNVVMPTKTKVTLKVLAMKATCDVPFTCKVRDLMTDGSLREYTIRDGLFTGTNYYHFDSVMTEEKL